MLRKYLILLLVIIPPIFFYGLSFNYSADIPSGDDYQALLDFLNQYIATTSAKQKLKLVLSQHSEHRIVYDRIMTLTDYHLFGKINFIYLSLLGNLSLLGVFYIFSRKLKEISDDVLYLVPISVLVFNISFWENTTTAMCTMSNLTVHLFSLSNIYFLTRKDSLKKSDKLWSIAFMVAAAFTQGAGVVLILVSILVLLMRKEYKFTLIYFLCSLSVLLIYFYQYIKPHRVSATEVIFEFKSRILLFIFSFIGNAFTYRPIHINSAIESTLIGGLIGFALFFLFLKGVQTKYYHKNLFAFSMMLFIIMLSGVSALSRCHFGLTAPGDSRYRINGVIFFICIFLWLVETGKINSIRNKAIMLVLSIFYFVFLNLNQYEFLHFWKRQQIVDAFIFYKWDFNAYNKNETYYYRNQLFLKSRKAGVYELPSFKSLESYFPYSTESVFNDDSLNFEGTTISVDSIMKISDSYLINGWGFIDKKATARQRVYIGLKSSDSTINYFNAKQEPRFDLNPYFHKWYLRDGGFTGRIKFRDIPKGEYKISLRIESDNEVRIKESDKILIH